MKQRIIVYNSMMWNEIVEPIEIYRNIFKTKKGSFVRFQNKSYPLMSASGDYIILN